MQKICFCGHVPWLYQYECRTFWPRTFRPRTFRPRTFRPQKMPKADISARTINCWGVDSMHVFMHTCVIHFLGLTVYSILPVFSYVLEALGRKNVTLTLVMLNNRLNICCTLFLSIFYQLFKWMNLLAEMKTVWILIS